MTLDMEEGMFQLSADRVAHGTRPLTRLFFLSAVGTSTEVRAVRAGLHMESKRKMQFRLKTPGRGSQEVLTKCEGYDVKLAPLGGHVYHLLAVAREECFLPDVRPRAVFARLAKVTTTPIHPAWAEWLCERLREEQLLQDVVAHGGLRAGLLVANDEHLDAIVKAGLAGRHIRVPA